MSADGPPGLSHILETVLYTRTDTQEKTSRFYNEVLGMSERGYRVGSGKLLIFNADKSTVQSSPPAHGTTGRGHTCFVSTPGDYDRWKDWLREAGVDIIEEIVWENAYRGNSFYFHDPAGNVIEIADRDIWPQHPRGE